jgi:hypothetical protein
LVCEAPSSGKYLRLSLLVVIRRFSLNEAPLGLFKFISDYLHYFEKINIFYVIGLTVTSDRTVEEQTRKNSNFPVRGIFKNPREIIVNIFR